MPLQKPPQLSRIFSSEEIDKILAENKIAQISIRLPVGCNLNCKYCYGSTGEGNLNFDEIESILKEAKALGCELVSFTGDGEPLLYRDNQRRKDIFDLVQLTRNFRMEVIIFTNQTLVTKEIANRLFNYGVTVIGKLNSLNEKVQDWLSGDGSYRAMQQGLEFLIQAGFNLTFPTKLSLHTVIIQQNYNEIPEIWRFCRKNNIIPYIQVYVLPLRTRKAKYSALLAVSQEQIKTLFHRLQEIDKNEFGFKWDDETYPIPGLGCCVVKTGVGITPEGNIQICSYTLDKLGDIRRNTLKEVLESEKVQKIRKTVYYPCAKNKHFYGCRALTTVLTGDRFAKDPIYWD